MDNNKEKNKTDIKETTKKQKTTEKIEKIEMHFNKEKKEPYPWEKNDEKYKDLKQVIERETDKSMKIDPDIMKSISNKFIEKLAELELARKNDLKNTLVKNAEKWALDGHEQNIPQGDAAIQALKSDDIESYNKIYDASLKEMIEENKEREKRINDLYALNEAFSKIYSNGEVPFEARRGALLELNSIDGTDYNSLKLRADLFEKITGKNFEQEYGVIIDENKFKKSEIENYETKTELNVKNFIKKVLEDKHLESRYKKIGFSAEILYKAVVLKELGDEKLNIGSRSKRKWYNPKNWLFPKKNIKYEGRYINKNELEEIINTKWVEKQNKDIEISLNKNNSNVIKRILDLTEEYEYDGGNSRKKTMDAMKEQLENDFIAKKLKTEKDAGKLFEKYEKKGKKFDMQGFAQEAGNLYKKITDNSSFNNNAGNISDFMNKYGFETTSSDVLGWNYEKQKGFIEAAKKKSSMMRYIMKMILDKI